MTSHSINPSIGRVVEKGTGPSSSDQAANDRPSPIAVGGPNDAQNMADAPGTGEQIYFNPQTNQILKYPAGVTPNPADIEGYQRVSPAPPGVDINYVEVANPEEAQAVADRSPDGSVTLYNADSGTVMVITPTDESTTVKVAGGEVTATTTSTTSTTTTTTTLAPQPQTAVIAPLAMGPDVEASGHTMPPLAHTMPPSESESTDTGGWVVVERTSSAGYTSHTMPP